MDIAGVLPVAVRAGFFSDDQSAILAGARQDGFRYIGDPRTPGFQAIRVPGEAVSVLLILGDGQVAQGDCAAVQYSGVGGRDQLLNSMEAMEQINRNVTPLLIGRDASSFRELAGEIDSLIVGGRRLHSAIRYGVTQAILDFVAKSRALTMAEVVRDEYETGQDLLPVPMFVQSGDDRYDAVDKMILKGVHALPHGLINNVETKLGTDGGLFASYVAWVRGRILALRKDDCYRPTMHFDVYGTIGIAFGSDNERMADYLSVLGETAAPFTLRIEHPVDAGSRERQVAALTALRTSLRARGSDVQIVVDEWCNTLEDIELFAAAGAADVIHVKTPDLGGVNNTAEALLTVRRHGLAAYCGGTCNETDRSGQVIANIAMACGADQILARPGMGGDEGLLIVGNEMLRVAALAGTRRGAATSACGPSR
jgi:methylaspartate ammonia-lyase